MQYHEVYYFLNVMSQTSLQYIDTKREPRHSLENTAE